MQGCDTNATYCQTYNGTEPSFFNRITAVNQISFFEGGLSIKFLQGVGIFSGSSGGDGYIVIWPNYFSGSCNMQLIYYHSDSLTWGSLPTGFDEVISTNPTFRLFPNPTSDCL
ncbi:MAG: hypothetical protein NTY88_06275 [Bacteroidetes bacterium]|nr:hypothetical protein [Bacteroidota bacterium]